MKKRKFKSKLVLNKEVITNLDEIKGGTPPPHKTKLYSIMAILCNTKMQCVIVHKRYLDEGQN